MKEFKDLKIAVAGTGYYVREKCLYLVWNVSLQCLTHSLNSKTASA